MSQACPETCPKRCPNAVTWRERCRKIPARDRSWDASRDGSCDGPLARWRHDHTAQPPRRRRHRPTSCSSASSSPTSPRPVRSSTRGTGAFAALLARAPADEDAALEVLALLEPELGVLAGRLVRLGVEPDVAQGEALSVAWEVVAGHRLGPLLPTKACLASVVWTELRREFGVRRDRGIELVPLTDEFDVAAPEVDPEEPWPDLLDAAVAAGVLNAHQAVVVAQTRIDGRGLAEVAADLGRPYHAVRKDRQRAEKALASVRPLLLRRGAPVIGHRALQARIVLVVEVGPGVGHPQLEAASVGLVADGPGAELPEHVVARCPAEAGRCGLFGLEAGAWPRGGRWRVGSAQFTMATTMWERSRSASIHSSLTSAKGAPRTRASASLRKAKASSPPVVSAWRLRPLEGEPVGEDPLDEVAVGGRLGQVLGADAAAQPGDGVAHGLLVEFSRAARAQADGDLRGLEVPVLVEDQVCEELDQERPAAVDLEPEDLAGAEHVEGGLVLGRRAGRGDLGGDGSGPNSSRRRRQPP